VTDRCDRSLQGRRDAPGAVAVVLQQVKRHPLRRLDADPGQPTQRVDERVEGRFSHG